MLYDLRIVNDFFFQTTFPNDSKLFKFFDERRASGMTDEWLLIYNTLIAVRLRLYRMSIHSVRNFSFHSDGKRASEAMIVLYLVNSRNQCFNQRTCYNSNSLYYIRIVLLLNIVFSLL